jgi:endoglucanase
MRIGGVRCLLLVLLAAAPLSIPSRSAAQDVLRGGKLWVDPASPARKQADAWRRSRPADAAYMRTMADQPQAIWLGEWVRDIRGEADRQVTRITKAGAVPVFVVYNIPHRDCGLHSAGGARSGDDYRRWVQNLARGIGERRVALVLEPDGIAAIDCMPARLKDERYVLLQEAVRTLSSGGSAVFVDAGNANWQQPAEMAARLRKAGGEGAHGFSLNVSNFHATDVNVRYGERLSALLGGKHFVVDTGRNGRGASVEADWCNAPGQALGRAPTTQTGHPLVDAFLWVKTPGQSDGTCHGGPSAGSWWPDYALELSKAAEALGSMIGGLPAR